VFGGVLLVLAVAFYLPATLLAPLHAVSPKMVSVTAPTSAAASITWPTYGESAVGAVGFKGVLASSGKTTPVPMASISKIITALVVLQKMPMKVNEVGPNITFTSADIALYNHYVALDGEVRPVHSGLVLSELQVLQVALIPSANNYATKLATWAFGSEKAFLPVAQAWIKANGLTNTTLVEPTGIDPANRSTASDLVALGKLALANPVIASVVSTKSVTIPDVGKLKNSNALLGIDGVTGMKTGTLNKYGANLLFTAEYKIGTETVLVVGAVLGGTTHPLIDKNIQTVLAGVSAGFHQVALTTKGTKYGSVSTSWGDNSAIVASSTQSVVVWSSTAVSVKVSAKPVTLASAGQKVGTVTFIIGTKTIAVPLVLSSTVADPGNAWRLTHPAELL
jgi:serine-type D-Ala-D-Ala carboxypeptidase (penicillin-binding protein 5/6)